MVRIERAEVHSVPTRNPAQTINGSMEDPIPLDESDLVPELPSAIFGPVKVPFLDPSWIVVIGLITALVGGPWWPPSVFLIACLVLFFICGPLVPRVCEANQAGLRVRLDSVVRMTIVRVPWVQLAQYSWRQNRQGRSLVLKVCRNQPGRVDNTYTWEFPAISDEEQARFDSVATVFCQPEQSPQ